MGCKSICVGLGAGRGGWEKLLEVVVAPLEGYFVKKSKHTYIAAEVGWGEIMVEKGVAWW